MRIPSYLLHKATGQALVVIRGKYHYLGKHGSPESKRKYDALIAAYLPTINVGPSGDRKICEILYHFFRHAKVKYGSSGKGPYGAAVNWRSVIRLVRLHHGKQRVSDFGPKTLANLVPKMVELGWSRTYINSQLGRIKRIWKWAAKEELIPFECYQRLTAVEGLRIGSARETAAVEPVQDALVDATLPYLPVVVRDMVRFQRLTGCRPGEVCRLRPREVDRSQEIWVWTAPEHKTAHHGKARTIFIGPRAQAILTPYLLRPEDYFCFSPAHKRSNHHYTTDSYRRAIQRACERRARDEEIPLQKWSPNQLRHAAATDVRRAFGVEHAQAILGHSRIATTEIYAAQTAHRAIEAASRLG